MIAENITDTLTDRGNCQRTKLPPGFESRVQELWSQHFLNNRKAAGLHAFTRALLHIPWVAENVPQNPRSLGRMAQMVGILIIALIKYAYICYNDFF